MLVREQVLCEQIQSGQDGAQLIKSRQSHNYIVKRGGVNDRIPYLNFFGLLLLSKGGL